MGPVCNQWFPANGTFGYTHEGVLFMLPDVWVSTMVGADQCAICSPSASSSCIPSGDLFTLYGRILAKSAAAVLLDCSPE